jgi:alpha-L-rhamnosidase
VDWIASHNPGGLRLNNLANNYGDWLCIPSDTSFGTHSPMKNLLATAYWADDCTKLARIARELGHDADAQRFQQMFEHVRAAFQKEWVEPNGRVTTDTQTCSPSRSIFCRKISVRRRLATLSKISRRSTGI